MIKTKTTTKDPLCLPYLIVFPLSPICFQKYEYTYNKTQTPKSKFDYALCLIRSPYKADMQKSSILLNELLATDEHNERDYLFHLAVVHTRLKEYLEAERYVRLLHTAEPNNSQVAQLMSVIKEKRTSQTVSDVAALSVFSAIVGMAIFVLRGALKS